MPKPDKKTRRHSKKTSIARRRRRRSLRDAYGTSFEALEQRRLLAAVTVSTSSDIVDGSTATISSLIAAPGFDGEISLREAIYAAENTFGTDTITFDPATFNGEAADVIRPQSPLVIENSIIIDGGDLGVVISGDRLGDDILVADSFVSHVAANELAGTISDNTDGVFDFAGFFSQDVTISGLTITGGNSSSSGGGIQALGAVNVTISESNISGNRAATSGGGIQSQTGVITIDQSSISWNVAHDQNSFRVAFGGGVASDFGILDVSNSTISNNVSDGEQSDGGGFHIGGADLILVNSTVSENIASSPFSVTTRGGGIHSRSDTISIVNSTITNNTAVSGGGIYLGPSGAGDPEFSISNTIVAGNTAGNFGPDLVTSFSTAPLIDFSLIGDNTGSGLNGSPFGGPDANGNFIGTSSNVIDPLLEELADNGGPTLTHALLPLSPARNAGNSLLSVDQRGVSRFISAGSDIGAFETGDFEIEGANFVVDNSNSTFNGNFSPGDLTLPEAIDLANNTPGSVTISFDADVFDGQEQDVIYLTDTLKIFESVTIDTGGLDVVVSGDTARNDTWFPATFISDVEASFNSSFDNVGVFETIIPDEGTVVFRGLTITGGHAFPDGGGILSNQGTLIVEDSIVSGNIADNFGGGIRAQQGSVIVTNSSISDNLSLGFGYPGGGGVSSSSADVTIVNSSIHRNSARSGGGLGSRDGDVAVTNSTVSSNSSVLAGGGIFVRNGALEVTNSTISGNQAGDLGSGIEAFGVLTITDSTITQNQTSSYYPGSNIGTGVRHSNNAPVTIRNSIIAGNLADASSSDLWLDFSVDTTITSSLIGSNTNNFLSPTPIGFSDPDGNIVGTQSQPIDPLLADLANNGGPTQTHRLLPASPAIDAGNSLSSIDQRGELRPFDQLPVADSQGSDGSDIGAFEFQALILTVDTSIDENDGDFSQGDLSLREAITIANNAPGSDAIVFDPNVFDGQVGDVIRLQFGALPITDGVLIDAGNTSVVVSADVSGNDIVDPDTFITDIEASDASGALLDNSARVFSIDTFVDDNVTFTGLTITGGDTPFGGGGINVDSSDLELINTSVSGNRSADDGGGILSNRSVTLTNSIVSGNVATNGGAGGGIASTYSGGVTLSGSTVSDNRASLGGGIYSRYLDVLVEDSVISGNTADGGTGGGGIYSFFGRVQITDSTVSGNQSSLRGGGIFTEYGAITVDGSTVSGNTALHAGGGIWSDSGGVTFSDSFLTNNATTNTGSAVFGINGGGGGIFTARSSVTAIESTFSGNSTFGEDAGGGAIASRFSIVTIFSSTFSGNSTFGDNAGGGAIATHSFSSVITNNSTFNGNETHGAGSHGGAITTDSGRIRTDFSTFSSNSTFGANANGGALATNTGNVTLTSSTITQNSVNAISSYGGGVFIENDFSNSPTFSVTNTIIARNNGRTARDLLLDPTTILDVNFSIIGDSTGALLPSTNGPDANGNLIGSFTAVIDPMLDVLSDNGGLTQTHGLLPGSPAIDAGSSSSGSDQRGRPFVRTSGNAPDIGAFESQTLSFVVDTTSDIVNDNLSSGDLSLREAIELANANPGEDAIRFSPVQFRGNTSDAIHLTQGELTITESVNIDGEENRVVVTGDRNRDDRNFSGTAITDLANNSEFQLDDNSAVFNITAGPGEVIALNGLIITGGIGSDGGGIRSETADVVIERSTIAGNRVSGNGGAIFNRTGLVTISNSTISGNEAIGDSASGGGIYFRSNQLSLANSTVSGNRVSGINANGGGIATSSGDFNINSVTITNNSATGDGGGIFVDNSTDHPHLAINNTIIAGNNSGTSPDLKFDFSQTYDINFSLIGDNSGTPFVTAALGSPDANGNLIGASTAIIDPLLDSLADVGGLTFTHQPQVGSPVINAGGSSALTTDQRNIPLLGRDDGGGVDIGAFERHEFFLVVDTSSDVNDGDYSSGNLSLREALLFSNANPALDTITFDASVFNQQPSDVIRLQLGELEISDGVVIDAAGSGVIISGDTGGNDVLVAGSFITDTFASDSNDTLSDNSVRVIDITAAAGEVVSLTGITITGGSTTNAFDDGGGIRNEDADLMLTDIAIVGNRTNRSGDGGGIYSDDGPVFLQNSTVDNNYSDSEGGGIYSSDGRVVLTDSTVIGNLSVFRGGGIYSSGANVTLSNSVVNANIAERDDGGGIYTSSGDVTLNNSSLSDNLAGDDGGGVTTSGGDLTIDRSTISGNQSGGTGGGIDTFSGDITLRNTTISGNLSGTLGGGIFTRLTDFTNILSSTIYNNQSEDDGGGIYHGSTSSSDVIVIENSIVAENSTANGTGPDLFLASGVITITRTSLIGTNDGTRLTATPLGVPNSTGSLIGSLESPVDPLLGNLSDNGGPTLTHALLAGSPAINAGGSVGVSIGTTDQRGEARIVDGQVDIGAFEVGSSFLLGDVDRNGVVNFLDISPLIGALSSNEFQAEADINRDGAVNFLDINPFIDLLSSPPPAVTLGDVDQNDKVDFLDINPFIGVLSNNDFQDEADINRDGTVNFLDINPFITVLSSQGRAETNTQLSATSPEPSLSKSVDSSQVKNLDDSLYLRSEIPVFNRASDAIELSDWKTDSLAGQEVSYEPVSQSASLLDSSPKPTTGTSSSDLFDAQPELLEEFTDFELDEVFDDLII